MADVAVVPRQRALNQVMLHFVEAHFLQARSASRSRGAQTEIAGAHQRSGRKQHATLDRVVELANVPRPGMLVKDLRGDGIESTDGLAVALRIAAQKMVCEQIDVFLALAQRRQVNFNRIQPEKQVLAESPGSCLRGYIHVGGGDHAHVHAPSAGRADALELAGL